MVKVNGKELDAAGMSIAALVEQEGYACDRVAVERNEAIVPKAEYGTALLQDGDTVEIVSFVGGG